MIICVPFSRKFLSPCSNHVSNNINLPGQPPRMATLKCYKGLRNGILDGLSGNYFSPLLEILNNRAMKKLWRVPFQGS